MKLFTRYNRINLLSTVLIFLLASVAYFFLLRYILIEEVDDHLVIEQNEIVSYVSKYNRLPETMPVTDQQIHYSLVDKALARRHFATVSGELEQVKKTEYFRQLSFTVLVNGKWNEVTVVKSLEGTDDIIKSIIGITIGTILVILAAALVINRMVLKKLWQPFYDTLDAMRKFQLGSSERLGFSKSRIDEFAYMNETLEHSLHKAEQDYLLLKEFTANASHELQTPLAIIRSKMDLLIQDENLTETQSRTVQSAYESIQKLARLNQSLLLLTKIENRQFSERQPVHLQQKIEEKQVQFNELWLNKHLTVSSRLSAVVINMNNELAEVLLNNLLSNATRHNFEGGHIDIQLAGKNLTVCNTGPALALDPVHLFSRFYKAAPSSDHNGLGLSIVKQICEISGFQVEYSFIKSLHRFNIRF